MFNENRLNEEKKEHQGDCNMRIISSLEKGLGILEYITESGSVRLAETAKEFDMNNSNMSIFMNTLVKTGFVYRDQVEKKYYVTNKLQKLANIAGKHSSEFLELVSIGEMRELHNQFNENVMLAVLSGFSSHYIAKIQSNHLTQIVDDNGIDYPLHATANGKVILAYKDNDFISRYLDTAEWTRYTDTSITSPEALLNELDKIRKKGYAINRGEYENSIMAIAAPIISQEGILASLVVQYPSFRHSAKELEGYAPVIVESAGKISTKLRQE